MAGDVWWLSTGRRNFYINHWHIGMTDSLYEHKTNMLRCVDRTNGSDGTLLVTLEWRHTRATVYMFTIIIIESK